MTRGAISAAGAAAIGVGGMMGAGLYSLLGVAMLSAEEMTTGYERLSRSSGKAQSRRRGAPILGT